MTAQRDRSPGKEHRLHAVPTLSARLGETTIPFVDAHWTLPTNRIEKL